MADDILSDWMLTSDILAQDVLRAAAAIDTTEDAYACAKRNYVRAVFAGIEGTTYGMKRIVLQVWKFQQKRLDANTLEKLTEVRLDENGNRKKYYLKFRENIKLVFDVFAKIHAITNTVDYGTRGWTALLEAVEVRDRLMHPKCSVDLEVTERDMENIKEAADWFYKARNHLTGSAIQSLRPLMCPPPPAIKV